MYTDPNCIRCGMCCIVMRCDFGQEVDRGPTGLCGYLTINEDDEAVCNCAEANEEYVGLGCHWQRDDWSDIYLLHMNEYNIIERVQELKEVQYGEEESQPSISNGKGFG